MEDTNHHEALITSPFAVTHCLQKYLNTLKKYSVLTPDDLLTPEEEMQEIAECMDPQDRIDYLLAQTIPYVCQRPATHGGYIISAYQIEPIAQLLQVPNTDRTVRSGIIKSALLRRAEIEGIQTDICLQQSSVCQLPQEEAALILNELTMEHASLHDLHLSLLHGLV